MKYQQTVDFAKAAEAMGVKGVDLAKSDDPMADLKNALLEHGPCVVNLPRSETEMVYPMVAPGGANADMIGGEAS